MKRPRFWWRGLILLSTLLVLLQYVTLTWFVPRYLIHWIQRTTGGIVQVNDARVFLPLTTMLAGVSAIQNTSEAALSIERVVLRPRWALVPSPQVWLEVLDMTRPYLRLTRDASGRWWQGAASGGGQAGTEPRALQRRVWPFTAVHLPTDGIHVQSIQVTEGTIELRDRSMTPAFHALIDHLSVVAGPVAIPVDAEYISFAVRGELASEKGASAPFYCSGWVAARKGDLDISCRLEPLELDLFEPYYQGSVLMRVSSAILEGTTRWSAKDNELNARTQLNLTRLRRGALTVRGRNLLDPKYVGPDKETSLRGEFRLTGPLHRPKEWLLELVPGNEPLQQVANRLLDLGIERVTFRWLGQRIGINLIPGSRATMSNIAASSKQIEDALEALVLPSVTEPPKAATQQRDAGVVPSPALTVPLPPVPAKPEPSAPEEPAASTTMSNDVPSFPATSPASAPLRKQ